jgi:hypothetical protein
MKELSNLQIDKIISLLRKGKQLPADYRVKLSNSNKIIDILL